MTNSFKLGKYEIGGSGRSFLIADVGMSHDGSLGIAHSYIDLARQAGADAVKFHAHIAQAESTYDEQFHVNFSYEDQSRFDYWKRMEFLPEQWFGLYKHAEVAGLEFLCEPYSLEAVEMVRRMENSAWSIGSADLTNGELIDEVVKDGRPVIVSTGMALYGEIEEAVSRLKEGDCPYAILQSTTQFPTPLERVGINLLEELKWRFDGAVGLSDHSGEIYPALLAMARGAHIVELHLTFHKSSFGPEASYAVTAEQFSEVVNARDAFQTLDKNPVVKDDMARDLGTVRGDFSRSLALKNDMPAGSRIEARDLVLKKPGSGLGADKKDNVVGMYLNRNVSARELLKEADLDTEEETVQARG